MAGGSRDVQLRLTIRTRGCSPRWLRRAPAIAAAVVFVVGWLVAAIFTGHVGSACGQQKTGATWWALVFEAAVGIAMAVIVAKRQLWRRSLPLMVFVAIATVLVMGEVTKYLPGGQEAWFATRSVHNNYYAEKRSSGSSSGGSSGYGGYAYDGYGYGNYRLEGSYSYEDTCNGPFGGVAAGAIVLSILNFCALIYLAVILSSQEQSSPMEAWGGKWFGLQVVEGASEGGEGEEKGEVAAGEGESESDEFLVVATERAAKGAQGTGDADV